MYGIREILYVCMPNKEGELESELELETEIEIETEPCESWAEKVPRLIRSDSSILAVMIVVIWLSVCFVHC